MSEIKETILQFKKEDFYETNYTEGSDCAITRALHRAGLTNYRDCGTDITNSSNEIVISDEYVVYKKLSDKVIAMYSFAKNTEMTNDDEVVQPIEPEDFEYALPIS